MKNKKLNSIKDIKNLFLIFLSLPIISMGQITFEEVIPANDFSIGTIRQSPTGERFVQAANDPNSVFSNTNGQDWVKETFPIECQMYNVQFYDDGTPLFNTQGTDNLIRRSGDWYLMNMVGGTENIKTSFLKEDTLFAYQDDTFGYSLDKGETFVTAFEYALGATDPTPGFWKFNSHYVILQQTITTGYLKVFDEQGTLVLSETFLLGNYPQFVFNDCGEILFLGNNYYYLLKEDGLTIEQGDPSVVLQGYNPLRPIASQGGNYYLKSGSVIYKTQGCNFNWEILAEDAGSSSNAFWVTDQEDVFVHAFNRNSYKELVNGASQWEEKIMDIPYPYVRKIIESADGHQFLKTGNNIFHKDLNDADWLSSNSFSNNHDIDYSPEGTIYFSGLSSKFYHSDDNGITIDTSYYSPTISDPYLAVLEEDVLLTYNYQRFSYSLDHGQNWNLVAYIFNNGWVDLPKAKIVEDTILVVNRQLGFFEVVAVDVLATGFNNFSIETLDFDADSTRYVIQDDGTFYFYTTATAQGEPGLYSYQFGSQPEFLGAYEELKTLPLKAPYFNHEIFGFGHESCMVYDGTNLDEIIYSGLPVDGTKQFYISHSNYLYVTLEENRIFRSTEPISQRYFISGTVYNDEDSDCVSDVGDEKLNFWQIKVENNDYLRIKTIEEDGEYRVPVPEGAFTVSSQPVNENWDLCESSFSVTIDDLNPQAVQDFQASGLVDCAALEFDFSTPRLRRCFDNYYAIRVRNMGPQVSAGSLLTIELDSFFEFSSATIPVDQINGNTLEFELGQIALNEEITFYIYFNLSCDADLGTEHCLTGTLTDDNLCTTSSSTYTECQENIGSFDPNDKRIFNEAGMETATIEKEEFLYYHIRFQNTGTDTAFTVRVVDPLSPILDLGTLEMLSASHSYTYEVVEGPELVVLFENILLPDSTTNEAASNGYFKFRIKPVAGSDYGTSIPNQAGIYFDFNEPIITNEATVVIEELVGASEPNHLIDFTLFPNPVNNTLTLAINQAQIKRIDAIEIRNQLGQRVKTVEASNLLVDGVIDVQPLVSGVYYLVIMEDGIRVGVEKFVKL